MKTQKELEQLPQPGTAFAAQLNTTVKPPNEAQRMDQIYMDKWLRAQAQDLAYRSNQVKKDEYLGTGLDEYGQITGTFPCWLAAGKNGPVPQPPKGFMAVAIQPENGGIVYDQQQVGPPVCVIPKY